MTTRNKTPGRATIQKLAAKEAKRLVNLFWQTAWVSNRRSFEQAKANAVIHHGQMMRVGKGVKGGVEAEIYKLEYKK